MDPAHKNPEAFDSRWVHHHRKLWWLWGHFDKDTVTFLRLRTSDASCHAEPREATLLTTIKSLAPKTPDIPNLGAFGKH